MGFVLLIVGMLLLTWLGVRTTEKWLDKHDIDKKDE